MTLPVPPYASQNPTPEPLMPSLPSIPQYPEAPAQTSFQTPSFPSLNEVPQAPQYPGNSPLSEEPPEDIQGPLIPRIPAIQNPPINLPPLSGTENLQNRPPQS
jgi:hypothetical protein